MEHIEEDEDKKMDRGNFEALLWLEMPERSSICRAHTNYLVG
jgi:hypothetical protein